jgi:hypothetical protein
MTTTYWVDVEAAKPPTVTLAIETDGPEPTEEQIAEALASEAEGMTLQGYLAEFIDREGYSVTGIDEIGT